MTVKETEPYYWEIYQIDHPNPTWRKSKWQFKQIRTYVPNWDYILIAYSQSKSKETLNIVQRGNPNTIYDNSFEKT